ncbi:MAG: MarR family transcriptional regulator [Nitrolancea sp.]
MDGLDTPINDEDYRRLAEFRYQIRRFLNFSTLAAREAGIEPRQHQLLLALRGLPFETQPTIGELGERLQLHHNTTVELINRLEARGFVRRRKSDHDRRKVFIDVTPEGDAMLLELSRHHLRELRSIGPELVRALERLTDDRGYEEAETQGENGE